VLRTPLYSTKHQQYDKALASMSIVTQRSAAGRSSGRGQRLAYSCKLTCRMHYIILTPTDVFGCNGRAELSCSLDPGNAQISVCQPADEVVLSGSLMVTL